MIITQTAAAVFDVRLLHVDGPSVLGMTLGLVLDALGNVLVFKAFHASVDERFTEQFEQFCVTYDETRLEQGGLGKHVGVSLIDCLVDGSRRVTDFEAEVPEGVEDEFNDGAEV